MKTTLAALAVISTHVACSMSTQTSSSAVTTQPDVPGTIFTIVFENENATQVLSPTIAPYFYSLSQQFGSAQAYTSSVHPSLPNYIMLTSGTTNGTNSDNDPLENVSIGGTSNIADQLDAAAVPWRAYMESMGAPCRTDTSGDYTAHHNPFLYYADMVNDATRCAKDVVDFDQNFAADLASNAYRYMWVSPNVCNDMHNCSAQTADAWLQKTVTQIQASAGYKNGGAIFILFDEGSLRIFGATAPLATIVLSPNLVTPTYTTSTPFDHRSYLATVEDALGLPRLPTTSGVTSMNEFFAAKKTVQ